tara:strand:- start:4419 stop:4871 length:453 start_codon:yes stop_codon:yes gene_type:complete
MTSALDKLNPRQRAFVHAYVAGATAGNAAASYVAAGYRARGKAAGNAGHRLLEKVGIKEAVAELREAVIKPREQGAILTHQRRLQILREIAEQADKDSDRISAIKLDAQLQGELVEQRATTTRTIDPDQAAKLLDEARRDLKRQGFKVVS